MFSPVNYEASAASALHRFSFDRCLALFLVCICPSNVRADDQQDFFESKIRPVLVEHCYACHSSEGKQIEGGLRLDSRAAMRRGGDSGPAVAPNDLDKSLIITAIKYDSLEMPPDQKLPDSVIANFEKWIEQGAIDPREEIVVKVEEVSSEIDFDRGREFWSFQRPVRTTAPVHSFGDWTINAIDDFVAARLEQQALTPAPRATSLHLLRRLSFDLVGLPPDENQFRNFQRLGNDDGYLKYVDELLLSESYGEHWARMWLDIMRYADDQAHIVGNNKSLCFPNSYLYRNWLIEALNRDISYDRFVELQLAADMLTPDDPTDDVALGFIGLGPKYYRRTSPEVQADEWEDRVDVLSRGLLGLTVACARCHDHKYDPVGTADYYALAGVFASVEMFNRPLDDDREVDDKGQSKNPEDALHIVRDIQPQDLSIMVRGDVNRKGPVVPRGFLTVLNSNDDGNDRRQSFNLGSGRLELAQQVVSDENPLTARVIVNRVWAKLIGKPLVGTPSNFGSLGERPTHPYLLDDLAVRFMENGWSLKWLCREIVTSATYRQASVELNDDADPENRWLARMNPKRLTVEQWRDAVLFAAGRLDTRLGEQNFDPSHPDSSRRTVYSEASRLKLNPMLALFDYPDPNVHNGKRAQTTTAAQKLFLMNSPFMITNANDFSRRMRERNLPLKAVIREAYRRFYAREPTAEEFDVASDFVSSAGGGFGEYIHALIAANEFSFVD